MKVKFVIPVINTEIGNYEYKGRDFTANEYFNMIQNRSIQTQKIMDDFVSNYRNGFSINSNYLANDLYDSKNVNKNKEIDYTFSESEALIFDGYDNDININDLYNYLTSGKKFLLKININPNSLDGNAESELRYWLKESKNILKDTTLDNKTMLLSLPLRDFIIDTAIGNDDDDNPIFQILNCRVIQIYPKVESGYDYYFAIMCGEIKKQ